jgi:phospholipid/cholesterol/gamma-HCH transport system substrate-binding protein
VRSANTVVGPLLKGAAFVVVTGLATAVLAVSVSNTGVGDTVSYTARFTDATSLNPGDDVRVSGVRVGQVDELRVVDRSVAEVRFSVDRGRTLPADVTAAIRYRNMIGQRYLALGRGDGSRESLEPGGEIPLERTTPALDLTELFNGFKPLFAALDPRDVDQLSGEIVQVLQGEGGTIESLLEHTASLTSTLAGRDQVIGQVITNLNTVLDTVNANGDALGTLISTVQTLVSGLAEDRAAIGDAIGGLADLSTATAGLFEDARPPLKDSVAGLDALSANLVAGQDDLDRFLVLLPSKLEAVGGAASYGSWLNFYLCSATLTTDPPQGVPATAARCRP